MNRGINAAEAIICPFWDPSLRELDRWSVEPGAAHGLEVRQFWCWTSFSWAHSTDSGPALRMSRDLEVTSAGYDSLVVSLVAPQLSRLKVTVNTDAGQAVFEAPPAEAVKVEHSIPLRGAERLESITLEVYEGDPRFRSGWFNWIGLASTAILPFYRRQWSGYDERWEGYLVPDDHAPSFTPALGIVATAAEIDSVRIRHESQFAGRGETPFTRMAEEVRGTAPEASIGEFVNFYSTTRMTNDTRYNRERDHEKALVTLGQKAAISGLVLKDAALLRLAARYALSIAMCDHWEDGMVNAFPGSTFDTRCFVQSLCLHDIAMILDLAGELFTELGRNYLLRRLSEEGLAVVTYNTWKYDYLFDCNQLAWFTPGRMLASLVIEHSWPRAAAYTDLCYRDLAESMDRSILPDGGFVEGPNYFQCVGRDACLSFYYYARARGLDFESVIPERIRRTDAFGSAIISTDPERDVIPICDAGSRFDQQAMIFLSYLMPGSAWTRMLGRSLERTGIPTSLPGYQLSLVDPSKTDAQASLVVLPEMGLATSWRLCDGEPVKLLVMGNRARAGHTHEDKGSFVLELAGEIFAMDPGTADYSHPLSVELKGCERHNMLVPTGLSERPHPASPIDRDVKPVVSGDDRRFEAALDLSPGWEAYYRSWRRRILSPEPCVLEIEDSWDLLCGDGVVCYWSTTLAVSLGANGVTISGRRARIVVTVPDGCSVDLEELPLPGAAVQRRIAIARKGSSGTLRVRAELAVVKS